MAEKESPMAKLADIMKGVTGSRPSKPPGAPPPGAKGAPPGAPPPGSRGPPPGAKPPGAPPGAPPPGAPPSSKPSAAAPAPAPAKAPPAAPAPAPAQPPAAAPKAAPGPQVTSSPMQAPRGPTPSITPVASPSPSPPKTPPAEPAPPKSGVASTTEALKNVFLARPSQGSSSASLGATKSPGSSFKDGSSSTGGSFRGAGPSAAGLTGSFKQPDNKIPGKGLVDHSQVTVQKVGGLLGAQHYFSDEEMLAFVSHINSSMKEDKDLARLLPVADGHQLIEKLSDGVILCKMINKAVPGTIDERALSLKPKNIYEKTENQNLAIDSAKAIGCSVVNIGAQDLIDGKVHLVLGLLWQIIQTELLAPVSLKEHPELTRLAEEGETLQDLSKLKAEEILLRWVNHHLKAAGSNRRVKNFTHDIKDSEVYTVLLHQVAGPEGCDLSPLKKMDPLERAEAVLKNADKIRCRKFVTAFTIVSGHPRLNLGFVATIFNERPGLEPATVHEVQQAKAVVEVRDEEGSREERAFKVWLNGLGVVDKHIDDLTDDLRNGLVLLKVLDKVIPGSVEWKKVNMEPTGKFKMVENCNMCVDIGKKNKFSLVGIGGQDITDANRTLTLALLWQIMRCHTLSILKSLVVNGVAVDEKYMISWANDKVAKSGRKSKMDSFKDSSLKTSVFFIDLLAAIEPRVVSQELVQPGRTEEEQMLNAKYVIAVCRKLGMSIFCVWEDLVQVKPKMLLTLTGGIMSYALARRT